jgi:hypothetical protein
MGGDDSQKLLPWRGMLVLPGAANLRRTAKSALYLRGYLFSGPGPLLVIGFNHYTEPLQ